MGCCALNKLPHGVICIFEATGSNLGRSINYPYLDFSWFSSVRTGKCQDTASNSAKAASFHVLPYSFFRSQSTIRRYILWFTYNRLTQIANKKSAKLCLQDLSVTVCTKRVSLAEEWQTVAFIAVTTGRGLAKISFSKKLPHRMSEQTPCFHALHKHRLCCSKKCVHFIYIRESKKNSKVLWLT